MWRNRRNLRLRAKFLRLVWAADAALLAWSFKYSQYLGQIYADVNARFDRMKTTGLRRLAVEVLSGGLTMALAGLFVILVLSQPAMHTASEDWLKQQDLAVTFLDRNGREVGRRGIRHDDSMTLNQYPDSLINAVLATEDRRFFEHWGVDPIGAARALVFNARSNAAMQGGSTITQQLAKNLFLTNERTLERKLKEVFLAFWLEARLSKQDILRLYLDRAYMGAGTFGVQAAAEYYFGKSARDVTLAEAAMLAGLFKAPSKYAPHINLPAARARAADVLQNLVSAGFMSEAQIYTALRDPASAIHHDDVASPDWYLDWAFSEVKNLAKAGKLGGDRVLTVKLALDSTLQDYAEKAIETQLRDQGHARSVTQAATVVMEPQTGAVRAIVGGRDYGVSQFNRASDSLRQTGSSFKPYVYLTALESGKFTPRTIVQDRPVCIGDWCPRNYKGSYAGDVSLTDALTYSLNTVAVRLSIDLGDPKRGVYESARLGREKIIATARKMGVTSALKDNAQLPIGESEISVLEHTAAYATFANGGKRVKAFAATEIRNSHGVVIYRQERDGEHPQRFFSEATIIDMNSMLMKVVEAGTGRRAHLGEAIKVGGKTGTTNDYKDAWFCGFTGNFNACVWFGNDDNSPTDGVTGGSLPAATWRDIMAEAHRGVAINPLPGQKPSYASPQPPVAATSAAPSAANLTSDAIEKTERLFSQAQMFSSFSQKLTDKTSPPSSVPSLGQSLSQSTVKDFSVLR